MSDSHHNGPITRPHYHSHASFYGKIFGVLIVLTVVTVAAAQVDFGVFNILIAMLIASVKAMLVALFFMHLKSEKPLTWLYAAFPLVLMFLLIGGVFIDNPFRSGKDATLTYHSNN
jgi:cytochrome c oxidase subunit 4